MWHWMNFMLWIVVYFPFQYYILSLIFLDIIRANLADLQIMVEFWWPYMNIERFSNNVIITNDFWVDWFLWQNVYLYSTSSNWSLLMINQRRERAIQLSCKFELLKRVSKKLKTLFILSSIHFSYQNWMKIHSTAPSVSAIKNVGCQQQNYIFGTT